MPQTKATYCRNCPSVCGLLVEVDNGRIEAIRGDHRHRLTQGYFCVKGQASMDLHNGEDRLIASMARQPDGRQAAVDTEAAMDAIHARLSAIIARHGPEAVALYYGTGANNNSLTHAAMKGWLHQIGSPYVFSSMTVDQSAKWVAMSRMGWFAAGKHDAIDADVLMEVGINPAVSHMSSTVPMTAPMRWLKDARRRGLQLIVVDPRRTETARQATIHLPVRPGEDAALFAGMIRLVLERGWEDKAFCGRFVVPLAALRQAVEPFTLDLVEARTGVERGLIEQAAELFARARRKSAASGTGPDMAAWSNLNEHLIETFNAICGGYRRAGDRARNGGALFPAADVHEAVFPPHRGWETGAKLKTAAVGAMFGEYPSILLPQEIVGSGENRIRALLVVGGNPVKAIPDPDRTIAAFEKLDLLVTLDPRPTETAAMSDYVIATTLPYERLDFTGMYDALYAMPFAQVALPLLDKPAGTIDDWRFFWGMAQRAGKSLELKRPMFGATHADIPAPVLTLRGDAEPTGEEIVRWMTSQGRTSFDELAASPQGMLLPEDRVVQPAAPDDGTRLEVCPSDVAAELAAYLAWSDEQPNYPFRLIVRRQLETMNSAYSKAGKTRDRFPTNPLFMHPDDMAAGGIANGASVAIVSVAGRIEATVRRDVTLQPGVVAMTHGWGSPDLRRDPSGRSGAFVGRLISIERDLQSINFMARLSSVPVAITALEVEEKP